MRLHSLSLTHCHNSSFVSCKVNVELCDLQLRHVQVSTDLWASSRPPRSRAPRLTAARRPASTSCRGPSTRTTPPPTTPPPPPPTGRTSPRTSTRRSCTSTGTTTTPGYQVQATNIFYSSRYFLDEVKYFFCNFVTIPGAYKRLDNEMLSSYYDRDRSKSKSPKPIFYKSPSPQRSHWGGYF